MKRRAPKRASMGDAFALLERDHRAVAALFARFERARGKRPRASIVRALVDELALHSAIEEQVLYPLARSVLRAPERILEAFEEHHLVKRTLAELQALAPDDEHLAPKLWVLRENVRHHVEKEERSLFPDLRRALSADALDRLRFDLDRARAAYSAKSKKRRAA